MKIDKNNLEKALGKEIQPPRRKRESRGKLHDRMTKFLPDFIDPGETDCNLGRVAIALGMTPQGVYKMMRPNETHRIHPKVAEALVELSAMSKKGEPDFVPATLHDFWEFVVS